MTLHRAKNTLSGAGYTLYLLKNDRLYAIDLAQYGEFYGYSVFLAVREDLVSVIQPLLKGPI